MRALIRLLATIATVVLLALVTGVLAASAAAPPARDAAPAEASRTSLGAVTGQAGSTSDVPDEVELVLFWGDGCPHCAAEHEWLDDIADDFPNLTVTEYEVWYDEDNRRLMQETADRMGFEASGVPTTIIGNRHWVGFSDAVKGQMETVLDAMGADGTVSAEGTLASDSTVDVPLVGEVSVSADSLVFSTLVIGFVDGVNPCSLWVISVLLAIVVRTGSRGRVMVIGTTFLLVTAVMYAVYMLGIYSAMSVMGHIGAIQVGVAVVAAVFGVVSVKDYFAFKKGLSFTIPDSAKPGIYRRMRDAAGQDRLLPAVGATIALAVGVSLLETPCTAGFPVLWTGLLTAHGVGTAEAAGLFGLYMAPFLVDELVVFALAVLTMRATKMQEKHGRLLKLVAGTMMLALAGTVLVSPELMSDPMSALLVFVGAFTVAWLVHRATTAADQRRHGADLPSSHQPNDRVNQGSTK